MMLADYLTYLPDDILCKVDRASMYYSLESRAPFLRKELVEIAYNIPTKFKIHKGISKLILRDILSEYIPKKLIDRPKMGFAIPIDKLLKNELKDWANDLLSKDICNLHGYFNYSVVQKTKNDHFNNVTNNQHKLWSLIQFNQWYTETYN